MNNIRKNFYLWLTVVVLLAISTALPACAQPAPTQATPTAATKAAPAQATPVAPTQAAPKAEPKAAAPTAVKPIKISLGTDLTGPTSGATVHVFRGFDHYIRSVNDQGGIDGATLELLWTDTQYKAALDVEFYKRARDQGSVLHMISATASGVALLDLASDDKMPVINFTGDHSFIVPPKTMTSGNAPYAYQTGTLLKAFLDNWKESRPPRLVWMGWDNPSIKGPASILKPWLAEKLVSSNGLKYEWAGEVYTAMRPPDFSTYHMKLRELKPDVVVFGMDPVDSGALARDAQRLGLSQAWTWMFLNAQAFGPDLIKIAGPEAVEGWIYPSPFESITANVPGSAKLKEALSKYQGAEGLEFDDRNYVAGWALASIAVETIRLAAKQVGISKVDRQAALNAMFSIKDLNTGGLTSPITLSKDKAYALDAIKMLRLKDGKPVPTSDWITLPRFVPGL